MQSLGAVASFSSPCFWLVRCAGGWFKVIGLLQKKERGDSSSGQTRDCKRMRGRCVISDRMGAPLRSCEYSMQCCRDCRAQVVVHVSALFASAKRRRQLCNFSPFFIDRRAVNELGKTIYRPQQRELEGDDRWVQRMSGRRRSTSS